MKLNELIIENKVVIRLKKYKIRKISTNIKRTIWEWIKNGVFCFPIFEEALFALIPDSGRVPLS